MLDPRRGPMTDWQPHTQQAREWFEALRTRICKEFEAIEREAGSDARFDYLEWQREEAGNESPGGGVRFTAEEDNRAYRSGFIYLPKVDPKRTAWQNKNYRHVGGGWWAWREEG